MFYICVLNTKNIQNYNGYTFYFITFYGKPFCMIEICSSGSKNAFLHNFCRRAVILIWKLVLESSYQQLSIAIKIKIRTTGTKE